MAHPSYNFPTTFYLVDEASVTATENFFELYCTASGNIDVYGSGLFSYVDIDAASGTEVVKYIDPSTGAAFVDVDAADGLDAGFYERVSTAGLTVALTAGQTIKGAFTKVVTPASSNASVVAYYK
jgi:hypothetical protein